ncbi:MAG: carbon storage regulator [Nanoarchaeota archaeon]
MIQYTNLILDRRKNEDIYIDINGKPIRIRVLGGLGSEKVKLAISAPSDYKISRAEILPQEELNRLEEIVQKNGNKKS